MELRTELKSRLRNARSWPSLIEELDYRSIARRLRIPVGTVRSRLNRARASLREVLARMLPEDSRPRSKCKGCRDPGEGS